jgi:hypothetical protein
MQSEAVEAIGNVQTATRSSRRLNPALHMPSILRTLLREEPTGVKKLRQQFQFGNTQTSRHPENHCGQGIGPELKTIFVSKTDPVVGALGFAGAIATIGPGDCGSAQENKNG